MKMCSLLNLEFPLHICFIYVLFCYTLIKRYYVLNVCSYSFIYSLLSLWSGTSSISVTCLPGCTNVFLMTADVPSHQGKLMHIYFVQQIKWFWCECNLQEAVIYLKLPWLAHREQLWKCLNIIRRMMKLFSNRRLKAHGVLMNFAS